jgi:hypothetical protein
MWPCGGAFFNSSDAGEDLKYYALRVFLAEVAPTDGGCGWFFLTFI